MMGVYRIVTLYCTGVIGAVWAYLSVTKGEMYVPPLEVQTFLVMLLTGKAAQTFIAERRHDRNDGPNGHRERPGSDIIQ